MGFRRPFRMWTYGCPCPSIFFKLTFAYKNIFIKFFFNLLVEPGYLILSRRVKPRFTVDRKTKGHAHTSALGCRRLYAQAPLCAHTQTLAHERIRVRTHASVCERGRLPMDEDTSVDAQGL